MKALTLRRYQRQDFYCTLCERNDFGSIDDLIDHIIPTHASSPTTVMNTGFFVCTLCYEKRHKDHKASTPPYCFLEAFDLALHVFKFHKSLAEGTRMKILLKMSARVELVTMHRTYNDEHGDDGLSEYLACTDDDVVMYPAANRVEEESATTSQPELPVDDASETNLGVNPKRGRPKGSKTRHLGGLKRDFAKNPMEVACQSAAADSSEDDEVGNLIIDETRSGANIDLEEPASVESGRGSWSDRDNTITDINDTPHWVSGKLRQAQPTHFCDSGKGTDRDLILHGRAIPPPPYRLKMKKKREELAKAKKIIADIKASEMAAASGIHLLPQEQQQQLLQQLQQQRQNVSIPQMQQWNFGQYHGTVTVRCPDSSSVGIGGSSSMQERGAPAESNPSPPLSPSPPPPPEVIMREEEVMPPPMSEVPTDEDSSPVKLKKLPKGKKGDNKKRRAQIEELRRKRIANRAKRLNCVLHEGLADPKELKKISMHKTLAMATREVKKLRTKEDILLECKQDLVQKRAALQKSLVENQMLERSRTGLQRRLALR